MSILLPTSLPGAQVRADHAPGEASLVYVREAKAGWRKVAALTAGPAMVTCADNTARHLAKFLGLETLLVRIDYFGRIWEVRPYTPQSA